MYVTAVWRHIIPSDDAVILDRECCECGVVALPDEHVWHLQLPEGIPFYAGDVIRVLCDKCKASWPRYTEMVLAHPDAGGDAPSPQMFEDMQSILEDAEHAIGIEGRY